MRGYFVAPYAGAPQPDERRRFVRCKFQLCRLGFHFPGTSRVLKSTRSIKSSQEHQDFPRVSRAFKRGRFAIGNCTGKDFDVSGYDGLIMMDSPRRCVAKILPAQYPPPPFTRAVCTQFYLFLCSFWSS